MTVNGKISSVDRIWITIVSLNINGRDFNTRVRTRTVILEFHPIRHPPSYNKALITSTRVNFRTVAILEMIISLWYLFALKIRVEDLPIVTIERQYFSQTYTYVTIGISYEGIS